jgi:hypothetical protein
MTATIPIMTRSKGTARFPAQRAFESPRSYTEIHRRTRRMLLYAESAARNVKCHSSSCEATPNESSSQRSTESRRATVAHLTCDQRFHPVVVGLFAPAYPRSRHTARGANTSRAGLFTALWPRTADPSLPWNVVPARAGRTASGRAGGPRLCRSN